jgi:hypothetical protein
MFEHVDPELMKFLWAMLDSVGFMLFMFFMFGSLD